jgi:hypothetical protein
MQEKNWRRNVIITVIELYDVPGIHVSAFFKFFISIGYLMYLHPGERCIVADIFVPGLNPVRIESQNFRPPRFNPAGEPAAAKHSEPLRTFANVANYCGA